MSLQASVHCLLQIVTFHSIDLLTSGHYKLTISLCLAGESPAQAIHLIPAVVPKLATSAPAQLVMGQYHSKSFILQYSNEEAHLGDVCVWKVEVGAREGLESCPVVAKVKLMYAESLQDCVASTPGIDTGDYEEIAEAIVRINAPLQGVHEFYKATFTKGIFATVSLLLHTSPEEWVSVGSDNDLTNALFPEAERVDATSLEFICSNYIHPHARHLQAVQESLATLRPFIPYFDTRFSPKISQNIFVDPTLIREGKLTKQYFDYFYENCKENTAENTAMWLLHILNYISTYLAELQKVICDLMIENRGDLVAYYQEICDTKVGRVFEAVIVRENHVCDTLPLKHEEEIREIHRELAQAKRIGELPEAGIMVEDGDKEKTKIAELPILFEEFYCVPHPKPSPSFPSSGTHLFVFVHGYGGSPSDLRNLSNFLTRKYSTNSYFLCAKSIHNSTDSDILHLGELLSREVKEFISEFCTGSFTRISFIGYSLGGVVARAALPHLEEFKDSMQTFLTLASPHLGLMNSSSALVDAGVWIFKSFKKSKCLKQLALSDNSDLTETALYRLSQHPGLRWFRRVLLFSSYLDSYSPMESARIELSKKVESSGSKGDVFVDMAGSLMSALEPERVTRVDVDFPLPGVSLDRLIGRKAHIEFITNHHFLTILSEKFPEAFT